MPQPTARLEQLEHQLRLTILTKALSNAALIEGLRIITNQPLQTVAELEAQARSVLVEWERVGA